MIRVHAQLLKRFGGVNGLRDESALASALDAAKNREYYEQASIATCAATYAYHLSQAHAFIDGNKRIAAAVAEIFLELNGAELFASNELIIDVFLKIAAGELTRDEVDQFFKQWIAVL